MHGGERLPSLLVKVSHPLYWAPFTVVPSRVSEASSLLSSVLWTKTTYCAPPEPELPPTVTPVTATDASPPSHGSMSRLKLAPFESTLLTPDWICAMSFGHEGNRWPRASICFHPSEPRSMFTSKNAIEVAGAAWAPSPSVPAAPAEPPPLEPPQPAARRPQAARTANARGREKVRRFIPNPP